MRLKRLELQGYKTFASKTEFLFDGGITAIVGPNGSGKSNVADAIRWVLGEQSYRLLRAKRTEDMIFHGSTQKARVGMAQAALTLDNSDEWLPLEFSEVTLSRRAYRSGENEYYLNGSRVRLRDVTELLAKSGLVKKNAIVIGQGHVDAALSLRPEERRSLFEEAANITLYQSKKNSAVNKLEATEQNLLRVRDVVAEIEPRMRNLQRQAQQAAAHRTLSSELEELLRVWYGYQWQQRRNAMQQSREQLNVARLKLAASQLRANRLEQEIASLRDEQHSIRVSLADWHRSSADLHTGAEAAQRDLAVTQERLRLLARQSSELHEELSPLEASRSGQLQRIGVAQQKLSELEATLASSAERLGDVESRYQAQQAARQEALVHVTAVQNELFDLATQLADRRNRIHQLGDRQQEQAKERQEHAEAIARQQEELDALQEERKALAAQLDGLTQQIGTQREMRGAAELSLQTSQERAGEIRARQAGIREEEAGLSARLQMLHRMHEEMVGFYNGPKAVVAAAHENRMSGIIGPVAEQIEVPDRLEKAIETALGGHLQDIITETWHDAEQAIQYLRRESAGRATFLPLETLRPPAPLKVPVTPGLLGVASELVTAPRRLSPVLDLLLGHTLVVIDLKSARALYEHLRPPFQIVTVEGELLRSTGAVTGGEETRKTGGVLSRRREMSDVQAKLRSLADGRSTLETELRAAVDDETEARQADARADERIKTLSAQAADLQSTSAELQRRMDKKAQEVEWRQAILGQLDGSIEVLRQKETQAQADIEHFAEEQAQAQALLESLQAKLQDLPDNLAVPLTEGRAAVALAEQNVENQKAILRSHAQSLSQLETQLAARRQRIEALRQEQAELEKAETEIRHRSDGLQSELEALSAQIQPAEARLAELEQSHLEQEDKLQGQRTELREAEQNHNRSMLEMERCRDELAGLKRQIEDDLGLVEVEMAEGLQTQPPLPLRPLVSSLPQVDSIPPDLQDQIQELRGQIRRLGPINPVAPAEYAETLDRHTFLTTQSEDLQEAGRSLRKVIDELDQVMNEEFKRTFTAIAEQFEGYFTLLFGGGAAQLVLTEPDSPMTSGVDIVARPPGKRTQSLALLSGGERSLTAAALIFSILKVSPSPFCVLDEVDAMLDESNVRRFRDALLELSKNTQFIVITHNRGTIEAAQTIYGVSMGADSVSRVLSLHLDQVEAKA